MRAVAVACAVVCALCAVRATRYTFYRAMGEGVGAAGGGGARRVFGGRAVEAGRADGAGGACALLDRWWAARCSGAVVAARWVLTAAHCVAPHVAYVKYNARRLDASAGELAAVHLLYRHPGYRAQLAADGPDVALLHHDVGLVRTRAPMALAERAALPALAAMRLYDGAALRGAEVRVLGFGRTEREALGERLLEVRLRVAGCERSAWFHVVCADSPGGAAGVCAGDSGGPVYYRGAQVAVTSMGPLQCGAGDAGAAPPQGATSVLTALYQYAELINATVHDTDEALRMRIINGAPPALRPPPAPALALALALRRLMS